MAITLSSLVLRVITNLSDVPETMLSDIIVYEQLVKAQQYISELVPSSTYTAKEEYVKTCIVNLAAYYCYISYTSIAERQLGELPTQTLVRLNSLREVALALLTPIVPVPLNPDLTVNETAMAEKGGLAYAITLSTLETE